MAKGCWCSRMLAQVVEDPRLVLAPIAARFVWLMLGRLLRDAPEPGVLRFPGSVSASVAPSDTDAVSEVETRCVARLAQVTEPEAADALRWLLAEGLLARRPGALVMAEAEEAGKRAAIARENGRKGGRNKKDGSPPVTRQIPMALPIPGGRSETQKTQDATEAETLSHAGAGTAAASAAVEGKDSKQAARELVSMGDDLAALAGLDAANGGYDYRPVQAWITAGIPLETMRAAMQRVMARPGWQGCRSLGYFDQAVREEHARIKPQASTLSAAQRDHLARLQAWDGNGDMPTLGEAAA